MDGTISAVKSMKVLTHTLDATVTSPMPSQTHWLISLTPSYRRAEAHKEHLIRERLDDAKARLLKGGEKAGEFTDITCATDHMVRREAQAAVKENRAPQYESQYHSSPVTVPRTLCFECSRTYHSRTRGR